MKINDILTVLTIKIAYKQIFFLLKIGCLLA